MRSKFILFISIFLICCSFSVSAQQAFTLHGVIFKKGTPDRLSQIIITNLNSKTKMLSDELGWFKITASVGDTLLFTAPDYTDLKLAVQSSKDMAVYMQPVITLNQVTIKGKSEKQELNEVMQEYRSQGTFYAGKPPALSFLFNPLTGIYELFGKTPNRAKRFAQFSKDELEYSVVKKRFSKETIKRVTNIPDEDLEKFMDNFTPSYEDIKNWNEYELMSYIKRSYQYFQKNKDKMKVQKLNTIEQPVKSLYP